MPRTMDEEREQRIRHTCGIGGVETRADSLLAELDAERAISAELLEACKEWVEIDGPTVSLEEQRRRWHGVVNKMKAAIAKAEGR